VVKADFEDPASLNAAFAGCDAVFAVTGALGRVAPPTFAQTSHDALLADSLLSHTCRLFPPSADFWVACKGDGDREVQQGDAAALPTGP
jgi:hypothetical protein